MRRAGIGLILPNDLDEAIKDIEFIAKAGLRGGVLLPLIPPDCGWLKPLYDPAWDRVYAAIQDHDLVINQHSGQGSPNYGEGPVPEALWISEVTFYCQTGFRHLLMSGAYEKFPKLKYILTESGCGWVGDMLKALDRIHMGFVHGAIGEMSYKDMEWVLKEKPSDYAARNCWYGASFPSIADLNGIDADRRRPRAVGQRLPALRRHVSVQPRIAAADVRRHARNAPPQSARRKRREAVQVRSRETEAARRAIRTDAGAGEHAAAARADPARLDVLPVPERAVRSLIDGHANATSASSTR